MSDAPSKEILERIGEMLEGGHEPPAPLPFGGPLVITDEDRAAAEDLRKAMAGEPQDRFTVVTYPEKDIKLVKR